MSLVSCQKSMFNVVAVLCVALGSRRMASTLPRVAIGPRKSTTPRQAPRHGEFCSFVKVEVYLSNLG